MTNFMEQLEKAQKDYIQTGKIRSFYSSFFAFNEAAMKKISANISYEIVLREEIHPSRLQAAVDRAVEICPYAAFEMEKRNGIVYFKNNGFPVLVHPLGTLEEFGTEENNFHYVAIFYEASKIIFHVSHVLTDGFGMNCFVQAVLDFYFGKEKTLYQGASQTDFIADLMSQDLPLPEGYIPKSYRAENHFAPPEIISSDLKATYDYAIEMPLQKFKAFCNQYNISAQIFVSLLLAKAIQKAHPNNKKTISVRGPVNTRIPLQVPHTFQNASIPHIFLNMEPHWLTGECPKEALERLREDLADQRSYQNLAAFTNHARKFFTTEDMAERDEIVRSYKTQTDIFANYMGKVFADDIAANISSFRQKLPASYPLMLYAFQCGDKMILHVSQSFENKIYLEYLSQIVNER